MLELHAPNDAAQWLRACVSGTIQSDSRKLRPGDGFIAWPGAAKDARQYVADALARGAKACLVESAGVERYPFSGESVASYAELKAASGPIAAAYFDHPSQRLDVLAVTGTNGKTSTVWWLAQALSNLKEVASIPCAMIGTLGIGRVPDVLATGLTTPDPVLLQQTFRHLVDEGVAACAIEASSIGIEEHRLDGTHIRSAIFTNLTQDHLDYHGSMAAYGKTKAKLFAWPGLQAAVINIDDPQGAALAAELASGGLNLWTVSCIRAARLQACDIRYEGPGLRFTVREANQPDQVLQTRLIGQYNVSNLLGVMAAMRSIGVPFKAALASCAELTPVPGRMEVVSVTAGLPQDAGGSAAHEATSVGARFAAGPPQGEAAPSGGSAVHEVTSVGATSQPLAVVDYAHTPDALGKALEALRPMAEQRGGKLWCVFGCGGDRDAAKRPLMGAMVASHADRVVVSSDNPRSEKPEVIISQILRGMTGQKAVIAQPDRGLAIAQALAQAAASDVLLIAGKGHEEYQELSDRRIPFSDLEHVRRALSVRLGPTGMAGVVHE